MGRPMPLESNLSHWMRLDSGSGFRGCSIQTIRGFRGLETVSFRGWRLGSLQRRIQRRLLR
ncbi:hypothetical protein DVH24_021299 [Malus domestica]|uniref:Uncharacterized protein n=1 Tax=Malus domestica TaxID=3750 RepID=A0A498HTL4_MALDO|nr:hypothetical protein DVH24_021299 [Malus domestica]